MSEQQSGGGQRPARGKLLARQQDDWVPPDEEKGEAEQAALDESAQSQAPQPGEGAEAPAPRKRGGSTS